MVQRLFAFPPGGGAPRRLDASDIDAARAGGGWLWIDVTDPTSAGVVRLGRRFAVDARTIDDIAETAEYPKLDKFDGYTFLVAHGLGTEAGRLETVELDCVIGSDFLLTFHRGTVPGVEWMIDQLDELPGEYTSSPDLVVARLSEVATRRLLPLLDALDERIESLEEPATFAEPSVLPEIQSLRRDAVVLRRIIGPQRDVYARLATSQFDHVSTDAQRIFAGVYDDQRRVVESLESARILLASVLDTYRSAVAENMNQVMKVLTVFSAILLPLSLMAGIYGMNFVNMPELDWRVGYFVLLGIMATTATVLWIYFARRGFIGAPRLDKVPRAVGRGLGGLVYLTTTPLRIVGGLIQVAIEDDPPDETDGSPQS